MHERIVQRCSAVIREYDSYNALQDKKDTRRRQTNSGNKINQCRGEGGAVVVLFVTKFVTRPSARVVIWVRVKISSGSSLFTLSSTDLARVPSRTCAGRPRPAGGIKQHPPNTPDHSSCSHSKPSQFAVRFRLPRAGAAAAIDHQSRVGAARGRMPYVPAETVRWSIAPSLPLQSAGPSGSSSSTAPRRANLAARKGSHQS
jgi:hypothetical protein